MELHQLRAFLAVAREGSISAAARQVLRTQPAVTMALQKLQRELGVRLLERSGRRVRLTRVGKVMAERTAPLVHGLDAAAREARSVDLAASAGSVRVVSDPDGLTWVLPQAARIFLRGRSDLQVEVRTGEGPDAVAMVGEGNADLALSRLLAVPPGFEVATVLRTPRTLVVPRTFGLVHEAGSPGLEDLADYPLLCSATRPDLAREIEALFAANGLYPKAVVHLPSWETVREYAAMGLGFAVVPGYCRARQDRRVESLLASKLFGEDVYRVVCKAEQVPRPGAELLARQLADAASSS